MSKATVALIRCSDYSQGKVSDAIEKQFELLGGLGKFVKPGDTVLIKPNLIAPKSKRKAVTTHPAVIFQTARLLKDFGARPFVGDSPAWGNVFGCIKALKLEEDLKRLSVPVRQLDKPKKCRIGAGDTIVGISSVALDADVIINLPKFKSHQQLVATFAVKNMFGCVSGKQKALWHFVKGKNAEEFCEFLIGIYRFLDPALTIIDGVTVMDGDGPINGRARNLGWLIGGAEPVACETVCSKLVNIDPADVPIIETAKKMGFGCSNLSEINIAGDLLDSVCTDFEKSELVPIRFSLFRVCRSICKQIILRTRSTMKKIRSNRN